MDRNPPPGAQPGDQISEGVVLLEVDGERVGVTVASFLLDKPSILPTILGVVTGLAGVYLLMRPGRVARAVVALLVAGGALLVGAMAFRSVPAETGPSSLLWLLPVVALASALVLILFRTRTATTVYLDGLGVAAGAALIGWGVTRFDALWRALIPTNAPQSLDRLVIAAALVAGAGLTLQGLYGLLRPQRLLPAPVLA